MIRSSASLLAEDVTVHCRVRRSNTNLNPNFGDAKEMTVTMRNWEARPMRFHHTNLIRRSSRTEDVQTRRMVDSDDHHNGPELLLTPLTNFITNKRDDSPVRRRASAYSIPIADILVVETCHYSYRLDVTTISYGMFELQCQNANGHDILLAFLQASLDQERILHGDGPSIAQVPSTTTSCLDLDGFTARQVRGRVENETLSEKISRRMGKVVHSLQEISGNFCDVACCKGSGSASVSGSSDGVREDAPHTVRETASTLDKSRSTAAAAAASSRCYYKGVVPALSMESDPEMENVR